MPMLPDPSVKYKPYPEFQVPNRQWPSKHITKAPRWLSSDLRDGNQALVNPMTIEQKTRFFEHLVKIGFKEIEAAYPAASDTDFNFVRDIISKRIGEKEGVWIQVLSPAREDLIRRTFDSIKDAPRAIFHMYNATSPLFRSVVFNNSKEQTVELAVKHIKIIRQLVDEAKANGSTTDFQLEYSPETFTQTEPDFAIEICNAVQETWFEGKDRSKEYPIIFNLPATVEIGPPNTYADLIEYFCTNIKNRDHVVISLHTHNDRGTGIAATELGLLAGADRVEGCLLGNGERTGNVDLVTLAINMYSQGVNPNLDFSNLFKTVETVTECNDLPVHPRHPWSGELVFTAFSGSHQDAIKKGFAIRNKLIASSDDETKEVTWEMPYLPVDPADLGCTYEAVIRVNSQSGKGGVSYIIQQRIGLDLPRRMQVAFYHVIQTVADRTGKEMTPEDIEHSFRAAYHLGEKYQGTFALLDYALENASSAGFQFSSPSSHPSGLSRVLSSSAKALGLSSQKQDDSSTTDEEKLRSARKFTGKIRYRESEKTILGEGNGPVSALLDALAKDCGLVLDVREYFEHAIGTTKETRAASYFELADQQGRSAWGVGIDVDVTAASLQAVLSAASALSISEQERVDEVSEAVETRGAPNPNGIAIGKK